MWYEHRKKILFNRTFFFYLCSLADTCELKLNDLYGAHNITINWASSEFCSGMLNVHSVHYSHLCWRLCRVFFFKYFISIFLHKQEFQARARKILRAHFNSTFSWWYSRDTEKLKLNSTRFSAYCRSRSRRRVGKEAVEWEKNNFRDHGTKIIFSVGFELFFWLLFCDFIFSLLQNEKAQASSSSSFGWLGYASWWERKRSF